MSEQKKVGLDIARSSTLVQEYQVMSWERNALPENEELAKVDAEIVADSENADLYMKKGLVLAGLGYYREAIECYSAAICINPFKWEYYRHRAHRFISCGLFADGVADFTIASRLNPTDWNVWYHLGLGYFLLGRYEKADWAYGVCESLSSTNDDLVAVTDWHFMTLQRMGKLDEARKLLEKITPDMEISDEVSGSYYKRLLVYKGVVAPEELFAGVNPEEGADLDVVTQGFGLANYYKLVGNEEQYKALLAKVIDTAAHSRWYSAFACLASHVDEANTAK